ncbi:L-fuconolactone hydrolase [Indibacter alkaliphilus LW1]|jgi:L-fuconolactonase|uniref:L-fuconolactone hydrolase n=1 Tax=Indibacter alkaliphilus (strain CCUG 57479 / KCTC 22604 / LW1) TaxID=1189612 RepID=S2DEI6_INDAL|nr:amidohydrolase family protein [Indibacter alkaliphilus]EOZ95430.1 L-fuconolactone hydrolase [Indibacter alkaliphilus LW1]
MRIDAHQHFWKFDPIRDSWIGDSMKAIQKDFLPKDLKPELDKRWLDGCIAVQADESLQETEFLLQMAKENPWIEGVVGWINLEGKDLDVQLEKYSEENKLVGFRKILQSLPPIALENPGFLKGISKLSKFDFTYDILIFPNHLDQAFQLAKKYPDQRFIIDHLAKPEIKNAEFGNWSRKISLFSDLENVYCKVSGMVTEADWQEWKTSHFHPYLEKVTETFGTKRLVFGSDWPVCLVAASYTEVYDIASVFFSSFSKTEQNDIFGENACRFYGLKG